MLQCCYKNIIFKGFNRGYITELQNTDTIEYSEQHDRSQTLKKSFFITSLVFIAFLVFISINKLNKNEHTVVNQSEVILETCEDDILPRHVDDVTIYKTVDKSIDLEDIYPTVQKGGHYKPPFCKSKHKVAILVPIRNREENLRIFLYNIHPFLIRQKLEYRIFVVEQSGEIKEVDFNKGRVFNAGFLEIRKTGDWQCVVFHDVDLLPVNDRIRYSCQKDPTHMSDIVFETEVIPNYKMFGGVTSMLISQYEAVNGYSNIYWNWGGEDDDMLIRLHAVGFNVSRYTDIGRYTKMPHEPSPRNKHRYRLLSDAKDRFEWDGLKDIRYILQNNTSYHLYTRLVVDIDLIPGTTVRSLDTTFDVNSLLYD